MKTFLTNIGERIVGIRKDCQGFVVMSTLAIFLFLFVLCAFVYAVGETIHQRIKMQNACDAAAYSAAVVQADGLSRMATVNRAMAWSYVQMTNRQMDYITYRWLKLTCKRFDEDLANAKKFNHLSVFAVDKELGWWALLEVAATAVLSELRDLECSGYRNPDDKLPSPVGHGDEGHGYWCGLEFGDRKSHNIRLNVNKEKQDNLWEQTKNAALDGIANMVFTRDNINTIISAFDFIDSDPKTVPVPANWGNRLGKLIDHDKANIRRMNNALARINKQMNISMKMTAESILKSMLKDNRIDSTNVLKDYFISIHIPNAANPYETGSEQRSAAGKSFFSPLRNTETDEMLFLNMISPEKTNLSLQDHFPKLLVTSGAFGLDKWFIRGKANYSDNQDHGYDATPLKDVSFAPRGEYSVTTERDEGSLGIQRVYKDTNLNETGAGFLVKDRIGKVGEHPARDVWRSRGYAALPQCCKDAVDYYDTESYSHNYYHVAKHDILGPLPDLKRAVWRGNHLIDLMNVTNIMTDGVKGFIGAAGGSSADENYKEEDDDESIIVGSQSELEDARKKAENERASYLQKKDDAIAQHNALQQERANATPERRQAIDDEIARLNDEIEGYDSLIKEADSGIADLGKYNPGAKQSQRDDGRNYSSQDQGLMGQIASTLLDGVSSAISGLIGQYLDIQPSCGNNPDLSYTQYPACKHVGEATTALYSEYRWASCKWYCLTNGFTYAICSALCDKKIYCDIPKRTIYEIPIFGKKIKIKGRGYGHWGWPKWFCGHGPSCSFIDNLPPLAGPVTGAKHGYMDSIWDFGDDGFLKPIKPLWSESDNIKDRVFSRKDYESCAMFPDGLDLNPALGHYAWPAFIRGHARIYADDKEIFDNRYVGAKCKPWVLNERFFAGDGTILVGAAMKHTNPFVQLFNFWNTNSKGNKKSRTYTTGDETQENAEKTVLSAFNIPEGNFMWTMSAARAGVRRLRRGGAFDQERQYQITYDSTCDAENLSYNAGPYVFTQTKNGDNDSGSWTSPDNWNGDSGENPKALSRSVRPDGNILPQIFSLDFRTFIVADPRDGNLNSNQDPAGSFQQTNVPIYNGCPCGKNNLQFKNMWNLCEADWDATLLPVRYAWQKAVLYLDPNSESDDEKSNPFNEQYYEERIALINDAYFKSFSSGENSKEKNDMVIGNGKNWLWNAVVDNVAFYKFANPFVVLKVFGKKADTTFFEDIANESVPGNIKTDRSLLSDEFNLNNKIPTGKEEEIVDVMSIIKDKVL